MAKIIVSMGPIQRLLLLVAVLSVAQLAQGVRRRLASASQHNSAWATPNYTLYHRQEDLLREVDAIVKANPGFMKLDIYTESEQDYQANVKVVTLEPGGFSNRQHEKVRMILDFGEHGRELISSELGLLLLRTLAEPGRVLEVFPDGPARGRELQRLLEGTVMKILPMENEGGRRLVEGGKLCERKNGRGVDPNRNWLVDWGKKEPDYDPNEEYPGAYPFSEPEVKILKQLATDFKPQVWLNVHSGMEAMLAPWDHKAEVAVEVQPAVALLEAIQRDVMANTSCVVGSGGKKVGYLAHGTATDYMFEVLHVPIASTWEIYGDFNAHFDDCFRMFNPVDESGVKDVLQRWLRAIMRLIELLPTHPALQDSNAWPVAVKQATKGEAAGGQDDSSSSAGVDATAAAAEGRDGGGGDVSKTGSGGGETGAAQDGPGTKSQGQGRGEPHEEALITTATTTTVVTAGSTSSSGDNRNGSIGSATTSDSAPRLTVVASRKPWINSWSTEIFSGLLAVAGLAVVGVLAFRCLSSADRRRVRGEFHAAV